MLACRIVALNSWADSASSLCQLGALWELQRWSLSSAWMKSGPTVVGNDSNTWRPTNTPTGRSALCWKNLRSSNPSGLPGSKGCGPGTAARTCGRAAVCGKRDLIDASLRNRLRITCRLHHSHRHHRLRSPRSHQQSSSDHRRGNADRFGWTDLRCARSQGRSQHTSTSKTETTGGTLGSKITRSSAGSLMEKEATLIVFPERHHLKQGRNRERS